MFGQPSEPPRWGASWPGAGVDGVVDGVVSPGAESLGAVDGVVSLGVVVEDWAHATAPPPTTSAPATAAATNAFLG
jgi:hypothetical protein